MGAGGLVGLCGLLGIRDILVPGLDGDAEGVARGSPQREPRSPVVGENPPAVRPVDLQNDSELFDGPVMGALQGEGSAIHTRIMVPLGHCVKRALPRIDDVPSKTAELKRPDLPGAIGGRFKTERERLKLTHADLTKRTGVGRFSIGRFEGGARGIDSDALLVLLFAIAEEGARLDYIILGRSGAAQVALTESSADMLAERVAARLAAPTRRASSK
jgi:hypothetical protein